MKVETTAAKTIRKSGSMNPESFRNHPTGAAHITTQKRLNIGRERRGRCIATQGRTRKASHTPRVTAYVGYLTDSREAVTRSFGMAKMRCTPGGAPLRNLPFARRR